MTLHKNWSHASGASFSFGNILARVRHAIKLEIPVGYQDESGFHYGVKSAAKNFKERVSF